MSHSTSTPVASTTTRAAAVTSGPIPSPGMSVMRWAMNRSVKDRAAVNRPPGPGLDTASLTKLDVREDVRFPDAGRVDVAMPSVGPHRVDRLAGGGKAAVFTDERGALEEALVRVPRRGADVGVRPRHAVILGVGLERLDVVVVWVVPAVQPDGEEL